MGMFDMTYDDVANGGVGKKNLGAPSPGSAITAPPSVPAMPVPAGVARNTSGNPNPQNAPNSIADIPRPAGQAQAQRSAPASQASAPVSVPSAASSAPVVAADPQATAQAQADNQALKHGAGVMADVISAPGRAIYNGASGIINGGIRVVNALAGSPVIEARAPYADFSGFTKLAEERSPAASPAAVNPGAKPENDNPAPAASAKVGGTTEAPTGTPMGIADMSSEQRFKAAGAYGDAVDKLTGVSRSGAKGIAGMTDRFAAYAKDDNALAMRNAREDLLGSGIKLERDGKGGMVITNNGKFDPIGGAQGSSIDMKVGNDALARANATTQSIIDKQPTGGVGILADANAEWNNRISVPSGLSNKQMANFLAQQAQTQATLRGQDLTHSAAIAGQGITARGQDMAAASDAAKLATDAPLKLAQTEGIAAQTASSKAMFDLQQKAIAGDADAAKKLNLLSGKHDKFTANVVGGGVNDMGQPQPQQLAVTGPDGRVSFHSANGSGAKAQAPASAIDYLKKNPGQSEAFKAKYGYLPEGF